MEDEENVEEELLLVESELDEIQGQIKRLLDRQEELYERQSQLKALLEVSEVSRNKSNYKSSVPLEDWSGSFPWDSQADDTRFNIFGITSYRSNQREIINAVMSGRDVLVIMAAGGGKSLCYQLPAVLRDGIALVVSPLLSLIQDQVMGLAALGIPAYMLTSTTNKEVEKFIYRALDKGEGDLKILYVTPEKISKSKRFMSKVEKCHHAGRLSLVAVDVYQKSPVGKVVIDEIANFIIESYPNNESGIVYCFSRKECEQVAKELRDRGVSAEHYHADMDIVAREKIHMRWSKGQSQVIVGTVAFGMGINKPDVRFVIHHSLSKSMETYYQESGRAGRDGLPSECVLYYRPGDVPRQSSMVFYENCGLQNLYDIVRYCQSKSCRRGAFFWHFGEALQDCNGMCDNCASSIELKDIDATCHTKILVSLLHDLQLIDQRATLLQLVDKFKVKCKGLGRLNQPIDLKREEIEQLIVQLIVDRVLKEEFQHTAYSTNAYVTLGPLWKPALEGNRPVKLEIAVLGSQARAGVGDTSKGTKRSRMSDLEAKLDELRRELSSSSTGGISIFPHAVLSTQQISLLSCQKPTTEAELEKVIGKVKTEKYGGRIIELMQSHIADPGAGNESVAKRRPKKDKDVVCVESSDDE